MRVDFTLGAACPASLLLKDACGIPFSAIVQPLAPPADGLPLCAAAGPAPLALLARCRHCYAYANARCDMTDAGFVCSLCGRETDVSRAPALRRRYLDDPAAARAQLPELACGAYEVDCTSEYLESLGVLPAAAPISGAPAFLFMLDASGGDEFLELVRAGGGQEAGERGL